MQPTYAKILAVTSIREARRRRLPMINELELGLDRSLRRRWGTRADELRVKRTVAALEANGISVLRAPDAAEAKRIVLELIPEGSQVHHGASQTLEDARAQAAYGIRSAVNKILVINREIVPGRLTVVLVDEVLGF